MNRRNIIAIIWLSLLLGVTGTLFGYNEAVYKRLTPVPANYHPVPFGRLVQLPKSLAPAGNKPVFIHFFNPSCPYSRFNVEQFTQLVKRYGNRIDFRIVVISGDHYTMADIYKKTGLKLPVSFDAGIAKTCGVYATPQAAILDADRHLYYRGNYNSSPYCTDEKTNYAQTAIEGVLHHNTQLTFSSLALRAYGCSLQGCTVKHQINHGTYHLTFQP